jgi:hypothetical protein
LASGERGERGDREKRGIIRVERVTSAIIRVVSCTAVRSAVVGIVTCPVRISVAEGGAIIRVVSWVVAVVVKIVVIRVVVSCVAIVSLVRVAIYIRRDRGKIVKECVIIIHCCAACVCSLLCLRLRVL